MPLRARLYNISQKSRSFTLQRLLRELQCYMTANFLWESTWLKKKTVLCVPSPVGWPRICHRLFQAVSGENGKARSARGEWWEISPQRSDRERLEIDLLQVDLLASGASLFLLFWPWSARPRTTKSTFFESLDWRRSRGMTHFLSFIGVTWPIPLSHKIWVVFIWGRLACFPWYNQDLGKRATWSLF